MIQDLKQFEAFLKLCRKQGVTDVTWDGLSVKLGEAPKKRKDSEVESEAPTDEISEEDLMNWSVKGLEA